MFAVQTHVRQGTITLERVHIGSSWQMRLNRSCAMAMQHFVKLLESCSCSDMAISVILCSLFMAKFHYTGPTHPAVFLLAA